MNIEMSFEANEQLAEASKPSMRALDYPAMCRPSRSLLSIPWRAMRAVMPRRRK